MQGIYDTYLFASFLPELDHFRASARMLALVQSTASRRDVLVGLTDAERAIVADGEKGRHAEATEREAGLGSLQFPRIAAEPSCPVVPFFPFLGERVSL